MDDDPIILVPQPAADPAADDARAERWLAVAGGWARVALALPWFVPAWCTAAVVGLFYRGLLAGWADARDFTEGRK